MKRAKLFTLFTIFLLVFIQFSLVLAAPSSNVADSISGTVQEITIETDANSGISTVWVIIQDYQGQDHQIHVSMTTALEWHLVIYEDEMLVPNGDSLGMEIEFPLSQAIPPNGDGDMTHPVGSALSSFFSENIPGINYEMIMDAHTNGYGFGILAQALWLTQKLGGDSSLLLDILEAKTSGDYSVFFPEDATIPSSWGQFRQMVMERGSLGMVISAKEKDIDRGNRQENRSDTANPPYENNHRNNANPGNHGNNENNGNNQDRGNNGHGDKP